MPPLVAEESLRHRDHVRAAPPLPRRSRFAATERKVHKKITWKLKGQKGKVKVTNDNSHSLVGRNENGVEPHRHRSRPTGHE